MEKHQDNIHSIDKVVQELTENLTQKILTQVNEEMERLRSKFTETIQKEISEISSKIRSSVIELHKTVEKDKKTLELLTKNKVMLDVGGIHFSTSLQTLTKFKNSKLAKLFSGETNLDSDDTGRIFIDRNGKYFEYILDSLRNEELVLPEEEPLKSLVIKEMKFFDLNELFPIENEDNNILNIFELDKLNKHPELLLSNNNLTVEKVNPNGHSSVIGNIEMKDGIYTWDVYIDNLVNNHWVALGVCERNNLSKDLTNDYSQSWMISSMFQCYKMTGKVKKIVEGRTYNLKLDFERDSFIITGQDLSVYNNIPIKGKKLHIIFNLYTTGNKITIRNFKKIK